MQTMYAHKIRVDMQINSISVPSLASGAQTMPMFLVILIFFQSAGNFEILVF